MNHRDMAETCSTIRRLLLLAWAPAAWAGCADPAVLQPRVMPTCVVAPSLLGQPFPIDLGGAFASLRPEPYQLLNSANDGPVTAFDGSVWVVAGLAGMPDDTAFAGIAATRLGCDGSVETPAFRVNTSPATQALWEPTLSADHGRVAIAWEANPLPDDTGGGLFYRLFDSQGASLFSAPRDLPFSANDFAREVYVTALDDGFVLSATTGVGNWESLLAPYMQRIDDSGDAVGAASVLLPGSDGHIQHVHPLVTALDDDTLIFDWTEESFFDVVGSFQAMVPAGASALSVAPANASTTGPALGTSMVSGDGHAYLALVDVDTAGDFLGGLHLKDAAAFDPAATRLDLTALGGVASGATVSAMDGGGAAAWIAWDTVPYSGTSGPVTVSLVIQRFGFDGRTWTPGAQVVRHGAMETMTTVQPAISCVGGSTCFVSWAEGSDWWNPDRLVGEFVDLK
jgi:hypothetical protein